MTPEERFERIEANLERQGAEIAKQSEGIRDLIVVSRTLVDSQREVVGQIRELTEAQRHTDEKLNILISTVDKLSDTVNRFVNGLQKPNGSQ